MRRRLERRHLFITARPTELPNNPIECSGHALRPTDLIILLCRVPIEFERPSLRAVLKQARQRKPHLNPVDFSLRGAADAGSQDMDRQGDHDALVLR